MLGSDNQQDQLSNYDFAEAGVPKNHPQRPIRKMVDKPLKELLVPPS